MLPAFLLKGVLEAIGAQDSTRLSLLAGGMIVVAIVTGVLGVYQTLLSNRVGQDVMHDLRSQVFRHLQRLSLAFFTRTRTGEVQSRISNDIGGVQSVLTSTATSIVSSVTTVAATAVGMIALSWELSLFAFALVPFFVLLTRRVGAQRRKIATSTQETLRGHLEPGPGVAFGLGDPAREDDGAHRGSSPIASRESRGSSPASRCAS